MSVPPTCRDVAGDGRVRVAILVDVPPCDEQSPSCTTILTTDLSVGLGAAIRQRAKDPASDQHVEAVVASSGNCRSPARFGWVAPSIGL